MSDRSSEEFSLPYKRPLIIGAVGIVVLLAGLALVNRMRLSWRLDDVRKDFCEFTIPATYAHGIDSLLGLRISGENVGDTLVRAINNLWRGPGNITLFFQRDSMIWDVTSWRGIGVAGVSDLPSGNHTWGDLVGAICTGTIAGNRLSVVRTIRTPAGRDVVLLLEAPGESGSDD